MGYIQHIHDKKVSNGQLRFVFIKGIGEAYLTADVERKISIGNRSYRRLNEKNLKAFLLLSSNMVEIFDIAQSLVVNVTVIIALLFLSLFLWSETVLTAAARDYISCHFVEIAGAVQF